MTPRSTKKRSSPAAAQPGSRAQQLMAAAQAPATTRSYKQAVAHFRAHGGTVPATAAMLVAYLAKFAGELAVATLSHRLIAIHRTHLDGGWPSPVMSAQVKKTMQGIRRTYGTGQRRVKAVVKNDLLEMLVMVDKQRPLKAARDRALLLVGFAGAFRRSELVGLKHEDITELSNGMEVLLRRSKTDQLGSGRTIFIPQANGDRCPVKALREWINLAGIESGWLFRPISRHDKLVGKRALTPQSVALVVKQSVGRVKGQEAARSVAGHSLRAGFVTEAATVGLQSYQIREVTGHRSDATLAKYIRPVAQRKVPSLL
jgi:integrase